MTSAYMLILCLNINKCVPVMHEFPDMVSCVEFAVEHKATLYRCKETKDIAQDQLMKLMFTGDASGLL